VLRATVQSLPNYIIARRQRRFGRNSLQRLDFTGIAGLLYTSIPRVRAAAPAHTIRSMIHEILPVGMLQCNCSIFGDEGTREAMVVDPGDDIDGILKILERHALVVKMIVITHAHIDHIGGAEKLKRATGAPVYMNENDIDLRDHLDVQAAWLGINPPDQTEIDAPAKEGDVLRIGAIDAHVLHTPGHTQGSICLWIPTENKLIAGDTLFQGSIGRTDLPGGDGAQILRSIESKILPLPEETEVIPGHGPTTTIGREKRHNWFLQDLG
jgi:hydroxyacylglutathione hydrolase